MPAIKQFKDVSETELEIMEVLWKLENPIASADLLTYFNNERQKGWKIQTISTFLSRLTDKGLVKSKYKGRGALYYPAISYEEYNQVKARSILEVMYDGSIKNFFVALYGDKKLTNDEVAELKKWLSER